MILFRKRTPQASGPAAFTLAAALVLLLMSEPSASAQEQTDPFSAQSTLLFARSLYDEGDYRRAAGEFLRYRFMLGEGGEDREIAFLVAKCRQRSGESLKAREDFLALASVGPSDEWAVRSRYETAIIDALAGNSAAAFAVFQEPGMPTLSDAYDPCLLWGWGLLLAGDWGTADSVLARSTSAFAPDLLALAQKGRALPRRDPLLAGILSTLLPGAGKLYADRAMDALFSFSLVGSLALLSGLGFSDEGIGSVKGWTYGSLALVFHAGNVYGAVVAAEKFNSDGAERIRAQARGFYDANLR